jgi:threonine dehydrogenase-like Zn-dependent dehydrogenase
MQALTLTEDGAIEWREAPEPTLGGPKEAIVRPTAVALCDLDRPIIAGEVPIPRPIAIGHEAVAEVTEVGDEVTSVSPGDIVVVPFQISCGECDRCRRGLTGDCRSVEPGSMFGFGAFGGEWGGLLSDFVCVPFADAMLVTLPSGIASEVAASVSDNLPDGLRTVAGPLEEMPGADVLIIGGGGPSIGLYAVDFARALGAGNVAYVDTDPERLRVAAELGAEAIEGPPAEHYERRPITVDASGRHEGLHAALRSTDRDGICTSIGIYFEPTTPMPLLEMYTTGVRFITGRPTARGSMPTILEMVGKGQIRPDLVISAVADWEEAPEAAALAHRKLVVRRD